MTDQKQSLDFDNETLKRSRFKSVYQSFLLQKDKKKSITLSARRTFLLGASSALFGAPAMAKSKKSDPAPVRIENHKTVVSSRSKYHHYINYLQKDFIKEGVVDASIVKRAMKLAYTPNSVSQSILRQAHNQPEFKWSWQTYSSKILTTRRYQLGQAAYNEWEPTLALIKKRFEMDRQPILGIWGIETRFGEVKGTYNVFQSLATLAFEGRRERFFKLQIIAALKILKQTGMAPEDLMGSYAGAMGHPQFMPESYLRFAVSMEDKAPNIWTSVPDSLASIANYIKKSGWHYGETWGQRVQLDHRFYNELSDAASDRFDMTHARTVKQWSEAGVSPLFGRAFPNPDVKAILVQPDGMQGESFLLYRNFQALMRYNASLYYGIAVGLLGDACVPPI